MIQYCFFVAYRFTCLVSTLGADCVVLRAHGGVAPPRNGMTIPRCRALPCTRKTTHSTRPTTVSRI